MGDQSPIEWTDATWNPTTGCTKVSQGCKHCYAERIFQRPYPGRAFTDVRRHPERLGQPLRWRKPRRIFVNSMSDLFHEDVPFEFIAAVFGVMVACPQHTLQILTKRPARMAEFFTFHDGDYSRNVAWWITAACLMLPHELTHGLRLRPSVDAVTGAALPNIWLGVSVENQETADERIPLLLQTPAAVRFLSCEPLLARINLSRWFDACPFSRRVDAPTHSWLFDGDDPYIVCHFCRERRDAITGRVIGTRFTPAPGIDWVIAGGESGPRARPMHPDWARSLRDQCQSAGVPFFMKQMWGKTKRSMPPIPDDLMIREYPDGR